MEKENVLSFLKYKFKPFSTKQCIERMILFWIINLFFYFVGSHFLLYGIIISCINLAISTFFFVMIKKYSKLMISRYLCDGITSLYFSLICLFLAYGFYVFQYDNNMFLLLQFLVLYCLVVALYMVVTCYFIKKGRYFADNNKNNKSSLPFIGSFSGFLIARFIFNGKQIPIETSGWLVSLILFVLASIIALGSVNFLKVLLIKTVKKEDGSLSSDEK